MPKCRSHQPVGLLSLLGLFPLTDSSFGSLPLHDVQILSFFMCVIMCKRGKRCLHSTIFFSEFYIIIIKVSLATNLDDSNIQRTKMKNS